MAKINQEIADSIREEYYEPGNDLKTLAEKYGVSVSAISDVISYKSWSKK